MAIQHTDRPAAGIRKDDGAPGKRGTACPRLGLVQLGTGIGPDRGAGWVARLIGVPDDDENRQMMRAVGMREVASGLGILSQPRPRDGYGRGSAAM